MQAFAQASENPPAKEQWKTMKRTMKNNAQNNRNSGLPAMLTSGWPVQVALLLDLGAAAPTPTRDLRAREKRRRKIQAIYRAAGRAKYRKGH
jgi:hypothetical protein